MAPLAPLVRVLGALVLASGIAACGGGPTRDLPHVLLVSIDTLRADVVGCYGTSAATPRLDALAQLGVRFERAYTSVPVTLPAHATMLTGTLPPFHGARHNGAFALRESTTTLAEMLRARGYRTAAVVGSAVLDSMFGVDAGFDTFDDLLADGAPTLGASDLPERSAGAVADAAIALLDAAPRDEPLFLFVHMYDPHAPYEPPAPFDERFEGRPYLGEVAYADEQVGRVIDRFDRFRGERDAILVATSDHGEGLGEHGEATHGLALYDTTVRVPLLIAARGGAIADVPGGAVRTDLAGLVDIVPTILSLAGIPAPDSPLHGSPLLPRPDPAGEGAPDDGRALYLETFYPQIGFGFDPLRGLRTDRFKLVTGPGAELYDLERDPGETHNLLASSTRIESPERELRARLDERIARSRSDEPFHRFTPPAWTVERLQALGYAFHAPARPALPELGPTDPGSPGRGRVPAPSSADGGSAAPAGGADERALRLRHAARFRPEPTRDPRDLLHLEGIAGELESLAATDATAALRRIEELDPQARSTGFVRHLEAQCRIERGETKQARDLLRAALDRNPRDAAAAARLAELRTRGGAEPDGATDLGDVTDLVDLAERFAGDCWTTRVLVAEVHARLGRRGAALRALERAEAAAGGAAPAAVLFVRARLLRSDDREAAGRALEKVLAANPFHAGAAVLLAEIELELGRPDAALQRLEPVSLPGEIDERVALLSARAHLAADRPRMAARILRDAIDAGPDEPAALRELLREIRARRDPRDSGD